MKLDPLTTDVKAVYFIEFRKRKRTGGGGWTLFGSRYDSMEEARHMAKYLGKSFPSEKYRAVAFRRG